MTVRQTQLEINIVEANDLDNATLSALGNLTIIMDLGRTFMVSRKEVAQYVESLDRTYEDDTTFRDNAYPELREMRQLLELLPNPFIVIEYEGDEWEKHINP
jgi:hypothetical protein